MLPDMARLDVTPRGRIRADPKAGQKVSLRGKLKNARLHTAVLMPRYPVVAVSAERICLFDGPVARTGPFATLQRDQVEVRHGGGPMWRRLDLIVPATDGDRS